MAVRDRHSRKKPAWKLDPRGGDIEDIERLIAWHERKRAEDIEYIERYTPGEFPDVGVSNAIAEHDRELKKLRAKLARLRKKNPARPFRRTSKPQNRAELVNEIERAFGMIKQHERAIENNRRYQETGDAYLIRAEAEAIDYYQNLARSLERALRELEKRTGNPMATKKKRRSPAQLAATRKMIAANRKKRAAAKRNPAYSNQSLYRKARAVARGSRKVNPKKSGPGYRGYVVASFAPKTERVEYWNGKAWGPHSGAATYSNTKIATYVAKTCKRFCAIASVNTAGADIRLKMLGLPVEKKPPLKFSRGFAEKMRR